MHKRARQAIVATVSGAVLVTGPWAAHAAVAGQGPAVDQLTREATAGQFIRPVAAATATPSPSPSPATATATPAAKAAPALPSGRATATSFWDAETASGKPMRYKTIASPYWPLGTQVKITYGGKSAIGVVEDFGPAEWAVAQHDIPAIVDLSEKMMAHLTGVRSNSVHVQFQVLKWGKGGVYRHSGTGYDLAMGRD
jgi:hypothetical protein